MPHFDQFPRPGENDPYVLKKAYFGANGRFWAKNPNCYRRKQNFWYPHKGKPARHLVRLVFWSGIGRNGPKIPSGHAILEILLNDPKVVLNRYASVQLEHSSYAFSYLVAMFTTPPSRAFGRSNSTRLKSDIRAVRDGEPKCKKF